MNCLSQELQNSSIDYVAASDLIQATRNTLIKLRSETSWSDTVKEADRLSVEMGSDRHGNSLVTQSWMHFL